MDVTSVATAIGGYAVTKAAYDTGVLKLALDTAEGTGKAVLSLLDKTGVGKVVPEVYDSVKGTVIDIFA